MLAAEFELKQVLAAMTNPNALNMPVPGMGANFAMEDFQQHIENMKNRETVTKLREFMDRELPKFSNILVHERDAFMVKKLLEAVHAHIKTKGTGGSLKIVAVVGMAHMDGIEKRWTEK